MQATAAAKKSNGSNKTSSAKGTRAATAVKRAGAAAPASGERHQNEGHGRRLTLAFEALEAFPALAESRNRLLTVIGKDHVATVVPDRKIHGFQVDSSTEEDLHFIALFNDRRNVGHFNLLFHNCADFSRVVLDTYLPHAIHRNFIADVGLMTPKQVARSLVAYGKKYPELHMTAFVIPQVPGSIPRSHPVDGVTESLVRISPYTVQGWRPLSVVVHPASTAINPSGMPNVAQRSQRGLVSSLPRANSTMPESTSANISNAMPTMIRNAKNTTATFGRSSRGKSFRPSTVPFGSCVR